MGLAAPDGCNGAGCQVYRRRIVNVQVDRTRLRQHFVVGVAVAGRAGVGQHGVGVGRYLVDRQRYFFRAPGFGQNEAIALMDGDATSQVGQGKDELPVAAIGRADQLKQRLIL